MTIESGSFTFHYIIEGDVVYLVLVDKSYPKKLAYQYLEELAKEFTSLYGQQIEGVARPYAFIKFDTFIQKTKKLYLDTRTQRNIERLNADIAEVHSIMTRNIQDVLGQGERLDRKQLHYLHCTSWLGNCFLTPPPPYLISYISSLPIVGMTEMSSMLSQDARQLAGKAKGLYHQALVRKYLPWVVVGSVLLLTMIIRFTFY